MKTQQKIFMNRELSWLKFNERVLEEAENKEVPLCERLTFASIYQSNLDEFFMVRVGSLIDQILLDKNMKENKTKMTPKEQLDAIMPQVRKLNRRKDNVYEEMMDSLKEHNIHFVNFQKISKKESEYLRAYFQAEIAPLISPTIIGKRQPFPFLKNKEMTQEEFFHTFNTLYEANKQIIISSDRLPREIETLEDRLRSRFESGLLADIQSPDLETRIAILRKKAESENISIPHDVISLVASSIDTNIREIEGAYTKIVAYASLMGSPITIDLAKKILDAMGTSTKNKQITFDDIIQVTSDYFKIKKEEFFTKKRTQNIAYPRQIAMYLCREMADFSYPRIGEFFGGRDHTTVIHAYEKIVKKIKEDPNCEKTITYLVDKLKQ